MKIGRLILMLAVAVALDFPAAAVREAPGTPPGSAHATGRFAPASLENLLLWLDAADRKTLYQDTAGKKTVRAADDRVAAWRDKSGGGRDAVQESPDARPAFRPKTQNGRSAIVFEGGRRWLDAGGIAPAFVPANWTVFLVVKPNLAGLGGKRGALAVLMASEPENRRARRGFQVAPSGRLEYKNRQGQDKRNVKSRYQTTGNWEIWEFVNDQGTLAILVDGDEKISEELEAKGNEGFSDAAIGAKKSNVASGFEDPWEGHIGEIIFYGDPKGPEERSQVRSYLSRKWGISMSASGASRQSKGEKQ